MNKSLLQKTVFLAALVLVFCENSQAQILNFEKYRKPGENEVQKKIIGEVSVDFALNNRSLNQNGETDIYVGTNIASDLARFTPDHAYYVFGDLIYSAVGEQEISSTGFVHLRANFWRKRITSYEMFTQAQFDQARNMDRRLLAGAGLRFKLIDNSQSKIAAGTGLMVEKERWSAIEKSLLKSTSYLSFAHSFNERVQFSTIGYFQSGYDENIEAFRNRISGEFILSAQIIGSLSYKTTFFIFYEDKPVEPVNKLIFTLTNGIVWRF